MQRPRTIMATIDANIYKIIKQSFNEKFRENIFINKEKII